MSISRPTKTCVEQLAALMIQDGEPVDLKTLIDSAFTSRTLPEHLMQGQDQDKPNLLMGGDEYRAFRKALYGLAQEPELEHLTTKEIDSSLWELCCELFVNRATFADRRKRTQRVNSYLVDIARLHSNFEVAIILENAEVTLQVSFGGVRIEHWAKEQADMWSIRDGDLAGDFVDMPVAITVVKAGHVDKAIPRAQRAVEQALDALRFGIISSSLVRVPDNALMIRQGERQLAREEAGGRSHRWSLAHRPHDTQLSQPITDRALAHLQPIQALFASTNLSPKVKERFSLALHWISAAISRRDHDEKVIDLCTAFESLFTDISDRRKGELVTLRAMLLQCAAEGRFTDTFPLLKLYELRSYLVHGTEIGICGDAHYRFLLNNLTRLLVMQAEFLNDRPEITTFKKFKRTIETPDMLSIALRWFEPLGDDAKNLLEEIRSRLR